MRLRLHRGSKIMLGGGWKQFYRQQVDKRTLYALAEKVLGVGQENIVEFFGAVEHPILYCACPNQHFHVPVYSRVIIRDVRTLAPLPAREAGPGEFDYADGRRNTGRKRAYRRFGGAA